MVEGRSVRTRLELPLGGHDLGVYAGDLDARVVAGLQVGLHDVASDGGAGADRAVVRALGAGEAALRPAWRGDSSDVRSRPSSNQHSGRTRNPIDLLQVLAVAAEQAQAESLLATCVNLLVTITNLPTDSSMFASLSWGRW